MITDVCQRWRSHRDSYRPVGELFDPRPHAVEPMASDAIARAFVLEHHYSASYPAARRRFGLYERGELVGVAVFSVPMHPLALRPWSPEEAMELGRFVLLDRVRANGESWFLARCLDSLRAEGFAGVISLSDPEPRTNATGSVVFGGHYGCIYQSSNATYTGRATARTLHLFPDGTVFSDRAAQKIRASEQGWKYAAAQLVAHGADEPTGDPRAWLRAALAQVTRTQRHHGNHRYLFALSRAARKTLPTGLAYPKIVRPS